MIKLNGTLIKSPSDYQLGVLTLTKSERNANGTLISEYIATKRKIEIQWKYLTGSEAKAISDIVKSSAIFFTVEYPELDGTLTTKTMYAGDFVLKTFKYIGGVIHWKDVPLSLIEQ